MYHSQIKSNICSLFRACKGIINPKEHSILFKQLFELPPKEAEKLQRRAHEDIQEGIYMA